jgi:exoribonuclease R
MELSKSDKLKLRVDALTARLDEVSAEISAAHAEANKAEEQMHAMSVEALMEGRAQPEEVSGLRDDVSQHEAAIPALEEQEAKLKRLRFEARRDHLRQLRKERPGQWLILE